MLNNIRNFSKTIYAKILLIIIVIPFVFWGMGSVFNSGNTNSIAKINKQNISTQDFIDYINSTKINNQVIRKNIENNALEELLSQLISNKILELEIKQLNLTVSEKSLIKKIKKTKIFLGENKKFSRIKYEKFLLSQNLDAVSFEQKLIKNELKNKLFEYISAGFKSPYFLTNKLYVEATSKIEVDYVNLDNSYKKENEFTENQILSYIEKNEENLKQDYIDFTYAKITPQNLIGANEFDENFFKEIDKLENKISNGLDLNSILKDITNKKIIKKKYLISNTSNDLEKKIYQKRNENKVQLLDENDFYVIYEIKNINKSLPKIDINFKKNISKTLYEQEKYEFNKILIKEINTKKFNQAKFDRISNNKSEKISLSSIDDIKKFTNDSVKLLYSLPLNAFTLVADNNNNVYLAKINSVTKKNIDKNSDDFNK